MRNLLDKVQRYITNSPPPDADQAASANPIKSATGQGSLLDRVQRYITDSPPPEENGTEENIAAAETLADSRQTENSAQQSVSGEQEQRHVVVQSLMPLLWQNFTPDEQELLLNNGITLESLANCSPDEKFFLLVSYFVYSKLKKKAWPQPVLNSALYELGVTFSMLAEIEKSIDLQALGVSTFSDIFIDIKSPLLEFCNFHTSVYIQNKKYILHGISATEYQHPLDTQYLAILKSTRGIDYAFKKITEHGIEPFMRINCIGSYLQVTADIMPEVHALLEQACAILELPEIPGLYVKQGFINGDTRADVKPLIVIDSMSLSLLNRDELLFLIGHELGHIKSSHLRYRMMSEALPLLSDVVGAATLGVGKIISLGLTVALDNWYRMSEFTADRAGLLCCQNIDAAMSVFMKLAGLPVKYYRNCAALLEPFKVQARNFVAMDNSNMNKFVKYASMLGEDHPWTIMRVRELLLWQDSGAYNEILKRHCPAAIADKN